jgi:hypothetical protein
MRQDVEFDAEGVALRGWLYLPDGATDPVPAVVMAHGFSAVKEMFLDSFAEAFAGGGLGALVFDNRNFGASDGEPRQEIDPWAQVRDYRHAITWAQTPLGGRPGPHRRGDQLQRRSRAGGRRDRQARQVRRRPGAAGQRLPQHPAAGPPGLHRPQPRGYGAGPRRPLPGRAAGDGPGGRPRPAGRLGAADSRLLGVVHRGRQEPRARVEERGHAAHRRC